METLDYIVVGSGIAGLHTAYRLKQQGKKVLVLEKESFVGGRMSTKFIDGHAVDFGAKFITAWYKNMHALMKELNLQSITTTLTRLAIKRDGQIYNLDVAKRFSALSFKGISLKAKLRLSLAFSIRLIQSRNIDFYKLQDTLYLDDKSVYDDLRPLAGAEAFDYILDPLCTNILLYGPTEFSRAAFLAILSKIFNFKTASFPNGIGELCQKMAATLPIELNVKVKSISKTTAGISVVAERNNQETSYQAKKLIFAIPGDKVLGFLKNPTPEEKTFFPQVRYSGTVQILCQAKTDLFKRATVIWTIPKEESNFTSFGTDPYKNSSDGTDYFIAALREEAFQRLSKENKLTDTYLTEAIQNEFPNMENLKIIDMRTWESGVPKFYPGYLKSLFAFQNSRNLDTSIYYCGDYLENPSTEGALTSSIKLLDKLKDY